MTRCTWTTVMRDSSPGVSASGRKPIRSPHSTTLSSEASRCNGAMMSAVERALTAAPGRLGAFVRYFLYLGSLGFGGPVALAGFMHRDLVEERRWVSADEYRLAMALAQIMPGP